MFTSFVTTLIAKTCWPSRWSMANNALIDRRKKKTLSLSLSSVCQPLANTENPFLSCPPCCSCSCCRLLTLNGCVLPSQESRPAARSTAGRRLSPGLPSVRQHAHTSAAKRRLSYDYNRNVVEWKEWSSGQRPVPQRPTDISGHLCAWRRRRDEKRGGVNSHSTSPLVFRWTQLHVLLFIQFPSRCRCAEPWSDSPAGLLSQDPSHCLSHLPVAFTAELTRQTYKHRNENMNHAASHSFSEGLQVQPVCLQANISEWI